MVRASENNRKLDAGLWVQLRGIEFASDLNGLLRASKTTLTVSENSDHARTTGHAASSTQLSDSFLPLASMVCSDAVGFAGHGNATCTILCGTSVCQCTFGVLVKEHGRHDQVLCHHVGVVLGQTAQLLPNRWVEIAWIQVSRNLWLVQALVQTLFAVARTLRTGMLSTVSAASVGMLELLATATTIVAAALATLTTTTRAS